MSVPPISESAGGALQQGEESAWLTPRAMEPDETAEAFSKRMGDRSLDCFGSLTAQAKQQGVTAWPSPQASEITSDLNMRSTDGRAKPNKLGWAVGQQEEACAWRTPDTSAGGISDSFYESKARPSGQPPQLRLQDQVRHWLSPTVGVAWPTPLAEDGSQRGIHYNEDGSVAAHSLNSMATKGLPLARPTPQASEGTKITGLEGQNSLTKMIRENGSLARGKNGLDNLHAQAAHLIPTTPSGTKSSKDGPRLNPRFVEWMLGYQIETTALEPWATAWMLSARGKPSKF